MKHDAVGEALRARLDQGSQPGEITGLYRRQRLPFDSRDHAVIAFQNDVHVKTWTLQDLAKGKRNARARTTAIGASRVSDTAGAAGFMY